VSDHLDGAMLCPNEAVSAIVDTAGNETIRATIHSAWNDDADAE
jgi:hypothetical protein